MAFRNNFVKRVGTTVTDVTGQIPTDGKTRTIIGLSLANRYGSGVLVNSFIKDDLSAYSAWSTLTPSVSTPALNSFIIGTDINGVEFIFQATTADGSTLAIGATDPFAPLDFETLIIGTSTVADGAVVWTAYADSRTFFAKNIPVASGAAEIIIGGDQKVVLYRNGTKDDRIYVTSSVANSVDVFISFLQED